MTHGHDLSIPDLRLTGPMDQTEWDAQNKSTVQKPDSSNFHRSSDFYHRCDQFIYLFFLVFFFFNVRKWEY